MTAAEFDTSSLSRAELAQASRIATAVSVRTRGNHAAAWRQLAAALHALAEQRDPQHQPCGCTDDQQCQQHQQAAAVARYGSRGRAGWPR